MLIFLIFCVVLLCVFMFWVLCCDVHYNFHINVMWCSFLPPIVCRRAHVCVCLRIVVSNTYCVVFFFILCTVLPASEFYHVYFNVLPVCLVIIFNNFINILWWSSLLRGNWRTWRKTYTCRKLMTNSVFALTHLPEARDK